jgi:hypothetical protein
MVQLSDLLLQHKPESAELDPFFHTRLMARIHEAHQEKDLVWSAIWDFGRKLVAVSSALLLVLVGGLLYDLTTTEPDIAVIIDSDMEPSFTNGPATNLVLQSEHPQKDQILEALLTAGWRAP